MNLDEHFKSHASSRRLFEALVAASPELQQAQQRVTKTQVAFRRRVAFAWAWIPEKHTGRVGAPLVLSVRLRRREPSPRWKQVVEPYPERFIHHLEILETRQIDEQVAAWLHEAFEEAG